MNVKGRRNGKGKGEVDIKCKKRKRRERLRERIYMHAVSRKGERKQRTIGKKGKEESGEKASSRDEERKG